MKKILILYPIFLLLFINACSTGIDSKKFEKVYRAAKAIQGAIAVGVNYQKFGELLQNLSTELSIADDIAKSDLEKKLLDRYKEGLSSYQDSYLIWQHKIDNARYDFIPSGEIFVEKDMIDIVMKYKLKTKNRSMSYSSFKTISESSIQSIWQVAKEQIDNANNLYNGGSP